MPWSSIPFPSAISSCSLLVTTFLVVLGPAGNPPTWTYAGLGIAVIATALGCTWALRHPTARATFYGLFAFVALELVLVAATSNRLR